MGGKHSFSFFSRLSEQWTVKSCQWAMRQWNAKINSSLWIPITEPSGSVVWFLKNQRFTFDSKIREIYYSWKIKCSNNRPIVRRLSIATKFCLIWHLIPVTNDNFRSKFGIIVNRFLVEISMDLDDEWNMDLVFWYDVNVYWCTRFFRKWKVT